ncbi:FmdB family zinc ribbon protein [Actinocrispum sp. NPDC049592]|uniref:FmdB family zinc ribbon protein n=1 Tax=Actinocrispum sp. NPDC049592 TaxID=3154835 RepID=UPI0034349F08
MPTYQYACTVCDHRFEQVQSFTDPSLTVCPECSGKLRKLYGSVGVVFKGSGFYRTDSRSSSSSSETSPVSAGASKSSEKTSTSTKSESSTSTTSTSSSSTPAAKAS